MLPPYRGRCWKLPDEVSSDQLIAPPHVFEFDPDVLRRHLLEELRPELAADARPGDVLVAGRRFAHGSNHSHPFIAMKAMGLGLLCRSISRGPYRLAVFMGVPLLTIDAATYDALDDGAAVEVDFAGGAVATRQAAFAAEPLPPFLMEVIVAGGGFEHAKVNGVRGGDVHRG